MSSYSSPRTVEEVLDQLARRPETRLLAGGTDLLVRLRQLASPACWPPLLSLENVDGLRGIERVGDELRIGAATTFSALIASSLVAELAPVLRCAAASVGAPAIRNMGTIGGNVCTASPAGDSLPALYVHEAEVELRRAGGTRRLPIERFVTGPGRTALEPGEIVAAVVLDVAPASAGAGRAAGPVRPFGRFEKVGRRESLAIAVASLAGRVWLDERGRVGQVRLAWGSVAPTVLRLSTVESMLSGEVLCPALVEAAAAEARARVRPIDDLRASAAYRRALAGNLLRRALELARAAIGMPGSAGTEAGGGR